MAAKSAIAVKKPRRSLEGRVFRIALVSGLPGIAAAALLLATQRTRPFLFCAVLIVLGISTVAFAFATRNRVVFGASDLEALRAAVGADG